MSRSIRKENRDPYQAPLEGTVSKNRQAKRTVDNVDPIVGSEAAASNSPSETSFFFVASALPPKADIS
jgi:hypothetical protein